MTSARVASSGTVRFGPVTPFDRGVPAALDRGLRARSRVSPLSPPQRRVPSGLVERETGADDGRVAAHRLERDAAGAAAFDSGAAGAGA